jgi:predicted DsbA family dithiol-disulfide isomerase
MLKLTIVNYTDPYCTWCWGSEPILRRIKEEYGDQVKITYRMGGLVEDIDKFYDPLNRIGGERWAEQAAAHWLDASRRHGMPVDVKVFEEIKGTFKSTYPANIAYKAAQFQGEELAERFLRRMREAAAAGRRHIHRREILVELAREVGLDPERFSKDFNTRAESAFYEDREECRRAGVTGFPTFRILGGKGREILKVGYTSFDAFVKMFNELAEGNLIRRELEGTDKGILAFIDKYGRAATREVAEVFRMSSSEATRRLEDLESRGEVAKTRAGNGHFWSLAKFVKITKVQK